MAVTHGLTAYTKGYCRCEVCTTANRDQMMRYNRRRGIKPRAQAKCVVCRRRAQRERARASKQFIDSHKTQCAHCGATDRLEFDHIDRADKTVNISRMQGWSKTRILKEIAKCQVLCRPCHIAKTTENGEWQ